MQALWACARKPQASPPASDAPRMPANEEADEEALDLRSKLMYFMYFRSTGARANLELGAAVIVVGASGIERNGTIVGETRYQVKIHYDGFSKEHDEWLARDSDRIKASTIVGASTDPLEEEDQRLLDRDGSLQEAPGDRLRDRTAKEEWEMTTAWGMRGLLKIGCSVEVLDDFKSDSRPAMTLTRGSTGLVERMDEEGDAYISFRSLDTKQWVCRKNFSKLRVLPEEPTVILDVSSQDQEPTVFLDGLSQDATVYAESAARGELEAHCTSASALLGREVSELPTLLQAEEGTAGALRTNAGLPLGQALGLEGRRCYAKQTSYWRRPAAALLLSSLVVAGVVTLGSRSTPEEAAPRGLEASGDVMVAAARPHGHFSTTTTTTSALTTTTTTANSSALLINQLVDEVAITSTTTVTLTSLSPSTTATVTLTSASSTGSSSTTAAVVSATQTSSTRRATRSTTWTATLDFHIHTPHDRPLTTTTDPELSSINDALLGAARPGSGGDAAEVAPLTLGIARGSEATCADTDDGARGTYDISCADYAAYPDRECVSFYDDSDFTLSDMCCDCGGGAAPATPATPAPTAAPSTPAPTATPATPAPTAAPATPALTAAPATRGKTSDASAFLASAQARPSGTAMDLLAIVAAAFLATTLAVAGLRRRSGTLSRRRVVLDAPALG